MPEASYGAEVSAAINSMFASIIGQPDAVARLDTWSQDPVHALHLVGPSGSGKRRAAMAFAGAVQARLANGDDDWRLRQLRLARKERHPDIEVVEPDGRSLEVQTCRERIIPAMFRKPLEGPRRIVVVDRFHDATSAAAASLLITVEEAPPSAIIVLLAERIPPDHVALASRCAQVGFVSVSAPDLASYLADRAVGEAEAATIIEAAGGSTERVNQLMSDPGLSQRSRLWKSVPSALDGSGSTAARLASEILEAINDANSPLTERHQTELDDLAAREEALGIKGSGRSAVEALHKRQLRRHRVDELQFGLRILSRYYGSALSAGGGPEMVEATRHLREANAALVRNPSESLLLLNLFWHLPVTSSGSSR